MRPSPRFLILPVLLTLWMTGCPPKQSLIKLSLEGAANLNRVNNGPANSVEIRIYQLKNKDRFERATFDALWNQEKETLAEDLINRQQKTLLPADKMSVDVQKDPQAMFVGVVAAFRESSGDAWRKVVPLQPKQSLQTVTINVGEKSVDVAGPPPAKSKNPLKIPKIKKGDAK